MSSSSSQPTATKLFDAIITNSEELVKTYLEEGIDPNVSIADAIEVLSDVKGEDNELSDKYKVLRGASTPNGAPTPLHVAVINCYHSSRDSKYSGAADRSIRILKDLLNRGADATAMSWNIYLPAIEGFIYHCFESDDKTPCGLAVFLKKYPNDLRKQEQFDCLDKVIECLNNASLKAGQQRLKTVPIPESVAKTLNNLLFSDKFSDIKFVCDDGKVILHAHRCFLAAASPYFEAALQGPWAENNESGEWVTSHPSHIMKAVLSLIYTGHINEELVDEEPMALLSVANEYNVGSLKVLAEASCIRSLNSGNVKEMLKSADIHGSQTLKQACFDYVKRHATAVLMNPAMIALMTEDPALWAELTKAVVPEKENVGGRKSESNKRARTS